MILKNKDTFKYLKLNNFPVQCVLEKLERAHLKAF